MVSTAFCESTHSLLGDLTSIEKKFAPEFLCYIGKKELLTEGRRVSVVGSRKVSEKGRRRAQDITKELVKNGFIVVSGLAEGVDQEAHYTAIEFGGSTIAVLGTPLSIPYPKSNIDLFNKIASDHLVISQFKEGYPIQRKNFPMRNRTMALISDATIIVEASEKSGTKHQAWEALRLGRLVFIMQNIMDDKSLSWPKEMTQYGAQVLTKENLKDSLENIPYLTSQTDLAF